jgi:predicted flap endonuclease-1-like 5' DNA nuclease
MAFQNQDRELLLKVKGVGPKVIERLEQIGFSSLEDLAEAKSTEITKWVSEELGATCWRNSPQARSTIESAITAAQSHIEKR